MSQQQETIVNNWDIVDSDYEHVLPVSLPYSATLLSVCLSQNARVQNLFDNKTCYSTITYYKIITIEIH